MNKPMTFGLWEVAKQGSKYKYRSADINQQQRNELQARLATGGKFMVAENTFKKESKHPTHILYFFDEQKDTGNPAPSAELP